ncbi:hypothetical protein BGW39_011262, partial [Mortierella sp. 14UC]
MALEDSTSDENIQAVRRVYEIDHLNTPASLSKIFHLGSHFDEVSGKDIILWDDVQAAFKDVVHVRSGTKILPFLKGRNFKNLDPLRIAAVQGITLDVVIAGPLVRSESSLEHEASITTSSEKLSVKTLQETLPRTPQEDDIVIHGAQPIVTAATVRRNPAFGLVEEAMQNYTHIDNPYTAPTPRGLQTAADIQAPASNTHGNIPEHQQSTNKSQIRAPQEHTSSAPETSTATATSDFAEALKKARLGDKDAQVA